MFTQRGSSFRGLLLDEQPKRYIFLVCTSGRRMWIPLLPLFWFLQFFWFTATADERKSANTLEDALQQQRMELAAQRMAIEKLEAKLSQMEQQGSSGSLRANDYVRRSCHEIRSFNPFLPSGMYWIDPDGQGFGEAPIHVHCNMKTGGTTIQHDTEAPITVQHCLKPGCYVRPVDYSFPASQLAALMDLSAQCLQTLKYDCQNAPWSVKGVAQSWWEDRKGVPRYFCPAGANDDSGHNSSFRNSSPAPAAVCQCNCDSSATTRTADTCVIKDKSLLPVTVLRFGGQGNAWSGRHTLSRIECTGAAAASNTPLMNEEEVTTSGPSSCQDLRLLGHGLSGYYSVRRSGQMSTVYCDMSRPSADPDHQRWIGYNGVKSIPVYFYVLRKSPYNVRDSLVPFEVEEVNAGGGMDIETGIFSAPVSGVYLFSFAGLRPPGASSAKVALRRLSNKQSHPSSGAEATTDLVAWTQRPAGDSKPGRHGYSSISLQSTLYLQSGDQVGIFLLAGALADSSSEHYTHFNGLLLQEM